eukprot:gnl/TRDRNA2_/TRDRNA2_46640_c0_seq1.p1 gnl/TRDRNA2_/TRDRNA2_46640_c0~~gnl/TRDRNA2_/TRDRNA2_46640_c0_seq1.p1  ORF type:complete len:536 (+),score=39.08 gnl/TRDRNA2_/TRDRNA2_46640_c0_seq1:76-1683(+)
MATRQKTDSSHGDSLAHSGKAKSLRRQLSIPSTQISGQQDPMPTSPNLSSSRAMRGGGSPPPPSSTVRRQASSPISPAIAAGATTPPPPGMRRQISAKVDTGLRRHHHHEHGLSATAPSEPPQSHRGPVPRPNRHGSPVMGRREGHGPRVPRSAGKPEQHVIRRVPSRSPSPPATPHPPGSPPFAPPVTRWNSGFLPASPNLSSPRVTRERSGSPPIGGFFEHGGRPHVVAYDAPSLQSPLLSGVPTPMQPWGMFAGATPYVPGALWPPFGAPQPAAPQGYVPMWVQPGVVQQQWARPVHTAGAFAPNTRGMRPQVVQGVVTGAVHRGHSPVPTGIANPVTPRVTTKEQKIPTAQVAPSDFGEGPLLIQSGWSGRATSPAATGFTSPRLTATSPGARTGPATGMTSAQKPHHYSTPDLQSPHMFQFATPAPPQNNFVTDGYLAASAAMFPGKSASFGPMKWERPDEKRSEATRSAQIEGKIRQWLNTIPTPDREWDDSQISKIANFGHDSLMHNLPAEEIYKHYVIHQVEMAERG